MRIKSAKFSLLFGCVMVLGLVSQAFAVQSGITTDGTTTAFTPTITTRANDTIDYANARPAPLPLNRAYSAARAKADMVRALTAPAPFVGPSGGEPGGAGTGEQKPVILAPALAERSSDAHVPRDSGTSGLPFSTERADLSSVTLTSYYPYRAVGKLFYKDGSTSYVCSASLIKHGIIVTAAHCAAKFGKNKFYSGWMFTPAYSNGVAPYGTWSIA